MRPSDRGRVDAAGPVDAQTAPTRSLENAQPAFSTAPTRVDTVLPMSSDKSVTHVSGSSATSLSPAAYVKTTSLTRARMNSNGRAVPAPQMAENLAGTV